MYKVGDEIIVTKGCIETSSKVLYGKPYKIIGINSPNKLHNTAGICIKPENEESWWLYNDDEFHLFKPKFKVGDKVRALISTSENGGYTEGKVYIVKSILNNTIHTEIDDNGDKNNGWGMKNFELVSSKPKKAKKKKANQFDCLMCEEELFPKPICKCGHRIIFKHKKKPYMKLKQCQMEDLPEDADCPHCCVTERENEEGGEYTECNHCEDIV